MECRREGWEVVSIGRRTPLNKGEARRATTMKRGTSLTTLPTTQTTPLIILHRAGGLVVLVERVVEEVIPGEAEFGTSSRLAGEGGTKVAGRVRKRVTREEAGGRESKEGGGGGARVPGRIGGDWGGALVQTPDSVPLPGSRIRPSLLSGRPLFLRT